MSLRELRLEIVVQKKLNSRLAAAARRSLARAHVVRVRAAAASVKTVVKRLCSRVHYIRCLQGNAPIHELLIHELLVH